MMFCSGSDLFPLLLSLRGRWTDGVTAVSHLRKAEEDDEEVRQRMMERENV